MKITEARVKGQSYSFIIGKFEVTEIKEQHDCIIIYFKDSTRIKYFNHSVTAIYYK